MKYMYIKYCWGGGGRWGEGEVVVVCLLKLKTSVYKNVPLIQLLCILVLGTSRGFRGSCLRGVLLCIGVCGCSIIVRLSVGCIVVQRCLWL